MSDEVCCDQGVLPSCTKIEDGEIHASLNQAKQMVSFTENPENYDSLAMVEYIDEQIAECMTLERKLSALDRDLAVDPRYVHRVSSFTLNTLHLVFTL